MTSEAGTGEAQARGSLLASHWFWLFALVGVSTAFDYWDHVSREGSPFAAAPLAWFGFTLASTVTLCALARGLAWLLGKLPVPQLAADTAGVALAIAAHLMLTGPLWSRALWSGAVPFDPPGLPVLAGALTYLFYRGLFLFARQLLRPPPSRA
ncbi:hypothetical protein [Erythrobacter sp.]|uniref:hypothetical protein n=1 Tax=Erythrobacter sp. TaxID=1042 RepID=UPI001425CCCA|nr:hypothetical protein [Erythrobacter sp.]QIQ87323.1 MAG: hypothetical protein G9473_11980 [Erythrobacter sp.]